MTQTVVVTGASAGVGRAVAHAYAARGARLALLARDGYESQQTSEEIDPRTWRDNLDEPGDDDTDRGTEGVFHDRARNRSAALWVGTHKPALSGVALAAAALALTAVARRRR